MNEIDDVHSGDGLRAVRATEEEREGEKQKAESKKQKPEDGGLRLVQATEEEQAAIRGMLSKLAESAPAGAGAGRAPALAWAGLRLAAIVLLAAGVGIGLGDGDEFDDVGCSVALRPARTSHEARSAQNRERAGGKLPVSGGRSAGASGGGGPDGGEAETLTRLRMASARQEGETFPIRVAEAGSCFDGGAKGCD